MHNDSPRLSFGVPLRNEEECLARCLDSILAQDYPDFEVVISDNASTDRTPELLKAYAARDPRIRLYLKQENVGQIENYNAVFHLARGEYFKWVGGDDWIEPGYASACVAALDADPGAIAVTNDFMNHDDQGNTKCLKYRGERLESDLPQRRFARMLWFFHAGDAVYDPLYGMMRRAVLARTPLFRMMTRSDWMLAAELSLMGRSCHLERLLFHRWKPYRELADEATLIRRFHPTRYKELPSSPWRFMRILSGIIWRTSLSPVQQLQCLGSIVAFVSKESRERLETAGRRFLKERLGITRKSIPFLRPLRR